MQKTLNFSDRTATQQSWYQARETVKTFLKMLHDKSITGSIPFSENDLRDRKALTSLRNTVKTMVNMRLKELKREIEEGHKKAEEHKKPHTDLSSFWSTTDPKLKLRNPLPYENGLGIQRSTKPQKLQKEHAELNTEFTNFSAACETLINAAPAPAKTAVRTQPKKLPQTLLVTDDYAIT